MLFILVSYFSKAMASSLNVAKIINNPKTAKQFFDYLHSVLTIPSSID